MGDHGKLYPTYTQEMQEKMRELMPYATIVTPNLTELCALIDEAYHETSNEQELKRMCEKLSQMGPKMIVVTGISIGHQILNFVYDHGKVEKIYVKRIGEDRSGTGDVIFQCYEFGNMDSGLGIDLSETGINFAKEFATVNKYTNLNFEMGDISYFDNYNGKPFDGIILSNVLDVMPKDIALKTFKGLTKLLAPKGLMFVKLNPFYEKTDMKQ